VKPYGQYICTAQLNRPGSVVQISSNQENEKIKLVVWPLAGLKIETEGKVLYSVRNARGGGGGGS